MVERAELPRMEPRVEPLVRVVPTVATRLVEAVAGALVPAAREGAGALAVSRSRSSRIPRPS